MTKYRARGTYRITGKVSFLTTCWRKTEQEAKDDIAIYGGNPAIWENCFIVERKK